VPENFGEILEQVEILRTGQHTASSGKQVEIRPEDLAQIADGYDPKFHEAPVVIGHPEDNQPAYGWVKGLQVLGDKLLATIDLVPEFVEALRQGLFKKRSASIYHDLDGKGPYLRHVGFLGAVPPAVKALTDINLDDKAFESVTIDFEERKQPMNWKDWFKKRIDEMPDDGAPVVIDSGAEPPAQSQAQFSEEDVKKREELAAEAAAKKAREEAELEFAERMRKTEAETAAKTHAATVISQLDALARDGKVLPAWRKAGLDEFAQGLGFQADTQFEFAEGDAQIKKTPSEWFLDFLGKLPPSIELNEFAGNDKSHSGTGDAAAKLGALTRKKLADKPELTYSLAFSEVQREHPDLAAEYVQELAR